MLPTTPPAIVLLHGVNGSHKEVQSLAEVLRPFGSVLAPDYIGHGGRPLPERINVPDVAADILRALDEKGIERAFFVGYSFGAYVAIYLARHFPERVRGICTLAAKVVLDAETIGHYVHLLDPERAARSPSVAGGAEVRRSDELARIHHPQDWKKVVLTNRAMFEALGREPAISDEDLNAVRVPVLVLSGDKDQIVSAKETVATGKALRARTFLFRGYAHPITAVPLKRLATIVGAWVSGVATAQDYAQDAAPQGGRGEAPAPGLH